MGEQMSDWTKDEGWMCGWISGFMDGWMDGWMNTYTVVKYSLDSASVLSQAFLHPRTSDF